MQFTSLSKAIVAATLFCMFLSGTVHADPFAKPGDNLLRVDLQFLNDAGLLNMPMTTWPLSYGDIAAGLRGIDSESVNTDVASALVRVRDRVRWESTSNAWRIDFGMSLASNPRIIRSFENTPREEGEIFARLNWLGERFAINLQGTVVANPFDGDEVRPDGSYVGVALGNWMLSAGWQERWWGPGNSSSLILSTNARPSPGLTIQRNNSAAFKTKWLSWIGPWSFTSFMNQLDDEREVNNALLFGARFSFRPVGGLEIGLSRTAQWCGDDRPCDLEALFNMLVGNDNKGVNVAPEDEPGNQLAGIDIRWSLPRQVPVALYMQWIGEDGRRGTPQPSNWLRQVGAEVWGSIGSLRHTTFFEVSNTICNQGGSGTGDEKPDCAYNHSIYLTGYRYSGRSIGHSIDGDGISYSLGSTLVQSAGQSWNVLLRYMEINKVGSPNAGHSLSATPLDIADIQVSYDRITDYGAFKLGLGYSRTDDEAIAETSNQVSAFIQWSSR